VSVATELITLAELSNLPAEVPICALAHRRTKDHGICSALNQGQADTLKRSVVNPFLEERRARHAQGSHILDHLPPAVTS
jgi:hypothetical protein